MTGGLIQLAAYGSQDHYLTGNPQISYFKMVYRRYTNFSMEGIKLSFEGETNINEQKTRKLICKLNRNADLISNVYFSFHLPSIYTNSNGKKFKWIKNIGTNIIESVSIFIGGALIDKHYGEWLNIWQELNLSDDKKKCYDSLIGNVEELYDPIKFNNGTYPETEPTNGFDNSNKITGCPSITEQSINVPLNFWFNRNIGLALPLIALQYSPIEIHVELRPLVDLYLISDDDLKWYKPNNLNTDGLHNFLRDTSFTESEGNNGTIRTIDLQAYLEVNYIFLDIDERKRFADTEHQYLIEQVGRTQSFGHYNISHMELMLHHPHKEIIWVAKRDDSYIRNDWNNYTNWVYEDMAPYRKKYLTQYDLNSIHFPHVENNKFLNEQAPNIEFRYLRKEIITKTNLLLNGLNRFGEKDYKYFNKLQAFQHHNTNPKDGIHSYSFSIDPDKYQPSGSCNMSRINSISIIFDVNPIPYNPINTLPYYKYDFNVYAINYNVLRIMGGMGGLEFSN
jgi:hypothetical protein